MRVGITAPIWLTAALCTLASCAGAPEYDVLIRGGTVYDGSGGPGFVKDVAIAGDTIAAVGDLRDARGVTEIDAGGLAVAPASSTC